MQELPSPERACDVVTKCIKACMASTFSFLYDNCLELYEREFENLLPDEVGLLSFLDSCDHVLHILIPLFAECLYSLLFPI